MTCTHHWIEIPGSKRGRHEKIPANNKKIAIKEQYRVYSDWKCKLCGEVKEFPIEFEQSDIPRRRQAVTPVEYDACDDVEI